MQIRGYRGFLIDTPGFGKLRAIRNGALVVEDGRILAVGSFDEISTREEFAEVNWKYSSESIIIPGLIDVHAHLPQYPASARRENGLLPWLERHVLPLEREFNAAVARTLAPSFFEAMAKNGTTCAALYTTIYEESCDVAFQAAEASGMRITMGKVMMDDMNYGNLPKDKVLETSLAQSERLCRRWHGRNDGLLTYAFSPRFAVACSREMMTEAAALAKKFDAYIQTHLAENHDEIVSVRQRFPECKSYADVYASCGLLGDRSILGQCVHLTDDEIALLVDTKSVVAHCPTSNFFLGCGIMPLDRLQNAGLRIGLGSDVAGGPELNMWQVMRSTIEAQQARSFYQNDVRVPSPADALYMATLGGAEALSIEEGTGSLDVAKDADFVVLDVARCLPTSKPSRNMLSDLNAHDLLSLLVYRGGPHAVVETIVRGRAVYQAPTSPLL
ncbi:MAG: guanine deaminase [Chthoniobacterales bacterium]